MDEPHLRYERDGRVVNIVLNRPHVLNALDTTTHHLFVEALARFDVDDEVDVAIVSGAGRAFCAGSDLRTRLGDQETMRSYLPPAAEGYLGRCFNWKPVIAAVHGYCLGAGFSFALESDLLVASEDAQFGMVETKRGIASGSLVAKLNAFMPSKVTTEIVLTGGFFSADLLARHGLVNRVTESGGHLGVARALADELLGLPPLAVRANVRMTRWAWSRATLELNLYTEGRRLYESADYWESVHAFNEGREPKFTGS